MILKLAALLAAISHTLHDIREELANDSAQHYHSITTLRLQRSAIAYRRRVARTLQAEAKLVGRARQLEANAAVSAKHKQKAQAIIDLVKGN